VYVILFDCHFDIAHFSIVNSQTITDTGQQDKHMHDVRADKRTHFQTNQNFVTF